MKRTKSYDRWITVGYELFAHKGPECIQIEGLARMLDLNKSGFYYYFGTLDTYFAHLMHHHADQINSSIKKMKSMQSFAPDYLHWLSEFTTPLLAQKQLMRSNQIPLFIITYHQTSKILETAILPLWAEYIGLSHNYSLASRYFALVRDVFFSRITPSSLSFESITNLVTEAKELCEDLRSSERSIDIEKMSA